MANYSETDTGLEIQFLQVGNTEADDRPSIPHGCKYVDQKFGLEQALDGIKEEHKQGVVWKRPEEISSAPQLFTQGASSFDIGQGQIGTCYFLSMLSHLAEHPRQLKQVIPDDAYTPGPDGDGVFHARFWRFGQWHDVYIDDYLPVYPDGRFWAASSDSDPNEFWVALLEKAFVRFNGNYATAEGGQPENAYITLTGGVAEMLEYEGGDAGFKTFNRIRNALNAKRPAFVASCVDGNYNSVMGLNGPHAYTVLDTAESGCYGNNPSWPPDKHFQKLRIQKPRKVNGALLLKIRNPWGHGEWTGPWSDGSSEYQQWMGKPPKDEGQFWIDTDNFLRFFSGTTVCNLTPDFDKDGSPDALKFVTNFLGKWDRETSKGWENKLYNPRLKFTIPQTGMQEVPVVVQLHQKRESRKDPNSLQVRCDLYKVKSTIAERLDDGKRPIMFTPKTISVSRLKLKPGAYLIVPCAMDKGVQKDFLVRLYTPVEVTASVISLTERYTEGSLAPVSASGETFDLDCFKMLDMAWVIGKNVGGTNQSETYHTNPQILIKTTNRITNVYREWEKERRKGASYNIFEALTECPAVRFILSQEEKENKPYLGLIMHFYPFKDQERALTRDELYRIGEMVTNTENAQYTFVRGARSIETDYVLNPNTSYIIVLFSEQPMDSPQGVVLTQLNLGILSSEKLYIKTSLRRYLPTPVPCYKTLEVIKGNVDAYVHVTHIKKWDICAGHVILKAVDGKMTTLEGSYITYHPNDDPKNGAGLLATTYNHYDYLKTLTPEMDTLKGKPKK